MELIQKKVFRNGLTVVTEKMPNLRSISLGVWLKKGSRHESAPENGISHFIEHLLFKGTAHRTAQEIALTIDSIGGQIDAFTGKEYTCFYAKVLDEHLPVALDLLSDIVLHPNFDPAEIEKERKVIFEEIRMVDDTPDELVYDLFNQHLWPDHPLGRPLTGTDKSLDRLGRKQLLEFRRNNYVAPAMVIAVAGNIEPARVQAVLVAFCTILPELEVTLHLFYILPLRLRAKHLAYALLAVSGLCWWTLTGLELGPVGMIAGSLFGLSTK